MMMHNVEEDGTEKKIRINTGMSPLDTFTWTLMVLLMLGRGDVVSGFYALCWLVNRPVGRAAPWAYGRTFHLLEDPQSDTEDDGSDDEPEATEPKTPEPEAPGDEVASRDASNSSGAEEVVIPTPTTAGVWKRLTTPA